MKSILITILLLGFLSSCKREEVTENSKWYIGKYYSVSQQDTTFLIINENTANLLDSGFIENFDVVYYDSERVNMVYDYRPIVGEFGDFGELSFSRNFILSYYIGPSISPSRQFIKL